MGNKKKERTKAWKQLLVFKAVKTEIVDLIMEHNFERLVRRGIIRKEK